MATGGEFSLVLSCGGLKCDGLCICSGTTNVVVNFDQNMENEKIERIMNFLDHTCGLFDKPVADWNKLMNVLKMLREQFKLIDDKMWQALYMWVPQHKKCGGVLSLCLNNKLDDIDITEVFIQPGRKMV